MSGKLRVYEVARDLGMDNKALVALLQSVGFSEVKNHMSAVAPEVVERVKRHLKRDTGEKVVEERIAPTVVKRRARPRSGTKESDAPASSPVSAPPPAPAVVRRRPPASTDNVPASSSTPSASHASAVSSAPASVPVSAPAPLPQEPAEPAAAKSAEPPPVSEVSRPVEPPPCGRAAGRVCARSGLRRGRGACLGRSTRPANSTEERARRRLGTASVRTTGAG
ncbi:MAG TPA: translation initiation factor IF-2 N-terminal domain-containing protein [Polyangiaceae bacterium]|nr:translation initiation factor IF-2 N-terminal domain-containing protein [Polyangiaceae bacterium]